MGEIAIRSRYLLVLATPLLFATACERRERPADLPDRPYAENLPERSPQSGSVPLYRVTVLDGGNVALDPVATDPSPDAPREQGDPADRFVITMERFRELAKNPPQEGAIVEMNVGPTGQPASLRYVHE